MGLRWKIALALAAIALTATTAVGIISYRSTSARLVDEVDRSITEASALLIGRAGNSRLQIPNRGVLETFSVRILDSNGEVIGSSFDVEYPVEPSATEVVGHLRAYDQSTVSVDGAEARVHTIGVPDGAIQIARSLDEVDRVLDDVRQRTTLLVIAVSFAAAVLGWVIAGTVAAPITRLTRAAEDVGESGRLDVEVPGTGSDEVGRLGAAFRNMLGTLSQSRAEQQRLVQDAGHELRTPLTSLRTNLAVMRRHPEMGEDMQTRILDDLDGEISELTDLVNELVAVASGDRGDQPAERIDLASLASEVAERVGRRRSRTVVVEVRTPSVVDAPRAALDRAITNLIDNACKFDQSEGEIDVVVDAGALTVLDRGPGIADEDLELIFDRFHRADAARSMPGSGLGLSIVKAVVENQGGEVTVAQRDGGGSEIGFVLPGSPGPLAAD
jgi:two-component system sensor histidine kinase MprB